MNSQCARAILGMVSTMLFLAGAITGSAWQSASAQQKAHIALSNFTHESVRIPLEPGWYEANKLHRENVFILQFLPPGDTAQNLHKMINICSYLGLQQKESARQFMNENKKQAEQLTAKASLDWKVVEDNSPGDVTFEYTVKNLANSPDQYEVQRIIQGQDGLHAVIYHLHRPDPSAAERQQMLAWVKSVSLVKPEAAK
jgi:hypothetical protein